MNKHLLAALAAITCTFGALSSSSGQSTAFTFDDGNGTPNAGSYAPGSTFTFSITLAFTAGGTIGNLEGVSYWFEQQNPSAPFSFSISLRDATGSQFTSLQSPSLTYPQTLMPQSANDLGAILPGLNGVGSGSYFIANISITIDAGAAPGTYTIENTTTGGKRSVVSDDQGHTFAVPQATYAITVIPEPSSLALLAVAGTGIAGFGVLRRKRLS